MHPLGAKRRLPPLSRKERPGKASKDAKGEGNPHPARGRSAGRGALTVAQRAIYTRHTLIRGTGDDGRYLTDRIILELPKRLTAEVTEYRFDRRLASRSDAFRRLIRLGLDTAARETDRRPPAPHPAP